MIEYLIAMCIPLALVTAWGTVMFCRIWWGHNPTYGVPARIRLGGWPRLRRWLTDGPLPEIHVWRVGLRVGCDCDEGCAVDLCPTFWCRGAWIGAGADGVLFIGERNNHKSTSQV